MTAPPRRPQSLRAAAVGALCSALLGCYTYAAAEPGAQRPGDEVRVTISDEEARRLDRADLLGAGNILEGVVEEVGRDSLLLSVRRPALRGVERFGSRRDTLRLAVGGLRGVEEHRLRPLQTAAAAIAGGGGLVAFYALVFGGAGEGGGDGGPEEPRLMLKFPLGR